MPRRSHDPELELIRLRPLVKLHEVDDSGGVDELEPTQIEDELAARVPNRIRERLSRRRVELAGQPDSTGLALARDLDPQGAGRDEARLGAVQRDSFSGGSVRRVPPASPEPV